jgi:hypothetical protein
LGRNPVTHNQVKLLQDNNIASNMTDDCEYLFTAVQSWLHTSATIQTNYEVVDTGTKTARLQWAKLLPVRCLWQRNDSIITTCSTFRKTSIDSMCDYWENTITPNPSREYFADAVGVRPGGILDITVQTTAPANFGDNETQVEFYVRAIYNETHSIALA